MLNKNKTKEETMKSLKNDLKLLDSSRFMTASISNLTENLSTNFIKTILIVGVFLSIEKFKIIC